MIRYRFSLLLPSGESILCFSSGSSPEEAERELLFAARYSMGACLAFLLHGPDLPPSLS